MNTPPWNNGPSWPFPQPEPKDDALPEQSPYRSTYPKDTPT